MPQLRVIEPGMFTTVQDLGRPGHAAIGVPPSGAADPLSLTIANRLLGNSDHAAALECTLIGPSITLESDTWVCLAGAMCPGAHIEGTGGQRPLPWCEPTRVRAGELITIGATIDDARAYLCVSGGLNVPPILNSRSTLVGVSLGGHEGRALKQGDALSLNNPTHKPKPLPGALHDWLRPHLQRRIFRVAHSLHTDRFPSVAIQQLTSDQFTVGEQSDRTGIRLHGPTISPPEHAGSFESEPTVTGSIQIAGDGRPIVLGPDRPTTGGYPLLACVIRTDLPALAMLRPRGTLRFEHICREKARQLATEHRSELDQLLPPSNDGPCI